MFKGFIDDMVKVVTLGTIAKMVLAFIVVFFDGPIKQVSGLFDLVTNFWQVYKSKRRTVFFDKVLERNAVKGQVVVSQIKAFLWKVKALIDQVKICVFH
jgi:hypothetical protein